MSDVGLVVDILKRSGKEVVRRREKRVLVAGAGFGRRVEVSGSEWTITDPDFVSDDVDLHRQSNLLYIPTTPRYEEEPTRY